jgi:hypothetical protein
MVRCLGRETIAARISASTEIRTKFDHPSTIATRLDGSRGWISRLRVRYPFLMYKDFHARDRWTKRNVHCIYQALIVAIATRHADATDIKFLVDGRSVWVALPMPAWVEYNKRTGKTITDPLAIEIAGHYLKTALESGDGLGQEMYSLTVPQTLDHLEAVVVEEAGVAP